MAALRETEYNEVYDAQSHFRSILDSMARPGKINVLKSVEIWRPAGMNEATAYVCFALLNGDVSYFMASSSSAAESYLRVNTGCQPAELEAADFILARGADSPELVTLAKDGELAYPEGGSSIVIDLDLVSDQPIEGALQITLTGPGIKGSRTIWARGWSAGWVEALAEKNAEFPLGVDTILTFNNAEGEACVVCIPRTTSIALA